MPSLLVGAGMTIRKGGEAAVANEKNLIPFNQRTESEQREIASRGGIASGEARRERKTFREGLLYLLNTPCEDQEGTQQDAILASLIRKAIGGDVRAIETIRDTIGEKPVEKVANVTPDPDVVSSVERALFGDDAL